MIGAQYSSLIEPYLAAMRGKAGGTGLTELAAAQALSPGAPAAPAPAKGGVQGWLQQAIDITGVPQWWMSPLQELVQKESGGNPNAYNDTPVASGQHAQGLLQTIPSTFKAYSQPGLGGINDPIANAVAAINYILDRYGSIRNIPTSGGY